MRVIGGEFRSRRLKALRGRALRPTSDRLRETLFNVLGDEVAGTTFVDAYAGTGAVGIEALSRGAAHAIFIENNRQAVSVLRENLRALGVERRATVLNRPARGALAGLRAGIVFLDPPYDELAEYEGALTALGDNPPSLVVAEHAARIALAPSYGSLRRARTLRQGSSSLGFYRPPHGSL